MNMPFLPTGATAILAVLFLTLLGGCKPDLCETVTCQNGGTCIGGGCDCPDGFTGARCEIELDPCTLRKCDGTGTDSCVVSPVTGEAVCICASGYEGDLCDTRWEEKYAGNFDAQEICDATSGNYPMSVQPGPDPGQLTLINFNNKQPNNLPAKVVANLLTTGSFQIYQQFMPFGEVTGQGGYRTSDGAIEFSYQLISNGDTLQCAALLTPQ